MSNLIPPALALQLKTGQKQSHLAFALYSLPKERRKASLVFYRFCRLLDDIVDTHTLTNSEKAQVLYAWQQALHHRDTEVLPSDLLQVIHRYQLDWLSLEAIVEGMQMDLTRNRYPDFQTLQTYCWKVACVVGQLSARIFGCSDEQSFLYANALGMALQLTNILRDVAEDAQRNRIYLPLEDLHRFGIEENLLFQATGSLHISRISRKTPLSSIPIPTPALLQLFAFESDRIEHYFHQAQMQLPQQHKKAFRAAETMRALYWTLFQRMRQDGFRVLQRRYRLNSWEKGWVFMMSWITG